MISNVRVIVRVRPFLAHETALQDEHTIPCVSVLAANAEIDSPDEVSVHLKDQETRLGF